MLDGASAPEDGAEEPEPGEAGDPAEPAAPAPGDGAEQHP
jgi:hypothetical protein